MVNDKPNPGSKVDAVFSALSHLPVGKSSFFFFKDGRANAWWTLNHEVFYVKGKLNDDETGEAEKIHHLHFWQQPDVKELRDITRRYEASSGKVFTISAKRVESKMLRVQRVY